MYSETLSDPLNDLDRYLMSDANEPRGPCRRRTPLGSRSR